MLFQLLELHQLAHLGRQLGDLVARQVEHLEVRHREDLLGRRQQLRRAQREHVGGERGGERAVELEDGLAAVADLLELLRQLPLLQLLAVHRDQGVLVTPGEKYFIFTTEIFANDNNIGNSDRCLHDLNINLG